MVFAVAGLFFMGDYAAPYRSPLGMILFSVQMLVYTAGLIWMKRLAAVKRPPRFLNAAGGGTK
jgi:hypothetical protein